MKFLHYLHYCYGKNEFGKLNSYGKYLEKREDKGDYVFNNLFFIFNIWWLARHRLYGGILLYVIPVFFTIFYFINKSLNDNTTIDNSEWFLNNVLTPSAPYIAGIHIFFSFIAFKLLQINIDNKIFKYKYDVNCVRDKIKPLDYIFTPIVGGILVALSQQYIRLCFSFIIN